MPYMHHPEPYLSCEPLSYPHPLWMHAPAPTPPIFQAKNMFIHRQSFPLQISMALFSTHQPLPRTQ